MISTKTSLVFFHFGFKSEFCSVDANTGSLDTISADPSGNICGVGDCASADPIDAADNLGAAGIVVSVCASDSADTSGVSGDFNGTIDVVGIISIS